MDIRQTSDLEFETLLGVVAKRPRALSLGSKLKIPDPPKPFVAPTLRLLGSELANPLEAEVIFVKASAAVGKSTIANYLSSALGVPLLDLSKIPVSTGSLKGLLLDISGAGNAIKAFHAGKLPIVIDAIDEGRLLSGEQGLESFLETTGEFLNEDRSTTNRPKLVFFGRYDSTEIAETWLELTGSDVKTCKLEVSFFGEEAAWKLINAYADAEAKPNSAYRQHPEPVRKLIAAYFNAIESALGLQPGNLWSSDQGKAFAGYAPVLAAMGSLLAQLDNFQDVANKLKETGTRVAWDVIETVLNEIIDREKDKLCDKLKSQIAAPLPAEAYDREEQLTLLVQFVHGQALRGSGRIKLVGADQSKYLTMIKAQIPEHPFVRNKEFGNAVLGSVVVSHAIIRNLLEPVNLERTAMLSRQPFLWRATVRMLSNSSEIHGSYLGYVLNSLWNDPIHSDCRVEIRSASDGAIASISLFYNKRRSATFIAKVPLTFYGQIKDCEVDLIGDVKILGDGPPSSTAFYARGSSIIMCTGLSVDAGSIRLEGDTWIEAEQVTTPPQFRIIVINGTKVGWGGNVSTRHPWNEIAATLSPPYDTVAPDDTLTAIVVALAQRTLPGGTVILNDDFSAVASDPHMRWARRQFATQLPELMKLLIKHGMASQTPLGASDHGSKVKMRFQFAWWDLVSALENPDTSPAWQSFVAEARRKIHG